MPGLRRGGAATHRLRDEEREGLVCYGVVSVYRRARTKSGRGQREFQGRREIMPLLERSWMERIVSRYYDLSSRGPTAKGQWPCLKATATIVPLRHQAWSFCEGSAAITDPLSLSWIFFMRVQLERSVKFYEPFKIDFMSSGGSTIICVTQRACWIDCVNFSGCGLVLSLQVSRYAVAVTFSIPVIAIARIVTQFNFFIDIRPSNCTRSVVQFSVGDC